MWNRMNLRLWLVLIAAVLFLTTVDAARGDDRIPVKNTDQLPRHTYPIDGSVAETIRSKDRFRLLVDAVRKDIETDLETYRIEDRSTLQRLHGVLFNIHMLERDFDAALARLEIIREMEDKEAARLLNGHWIRAFVPARAEAGDDETAFRAAFQRILLERLRAMPWEVVGDRLRWARQDAESMTENVLFGIVQSRFEPVAAESGEVSAHLARQFVTARYMLEFEIPLRRERIAVYKKLIDENRVEKADRWTERQVCLADGLDLSPVLVCVWDTGLDTSLFPGRLFVNPGEAHDGRDSDGNEFVDDVYGIAYDFEGEPTTGLLHPLDDLHKSLERVTELDRGSKDIAAGIESEAAAAFRRHVNTLSPEDYQVFGEDQVLLGVYQHGTHVTGITAEGNPFARILTVRFTGEHRTIPKAPTKERALREARAMRTTVGYLRKHGVRVVNMSWLNNRSLIESALEANGVGSTADERGRLAREIYTIECEALFSAVEEASEILFVAAAGNFDNDVDFSEAYPAGFDLPNVLVVGAVDQAGAPTGFTSFGRTVQVYANGFEVDGLVPGGGRKKMSGTSMSSPAAANLAAKILAVESTLAPADVIDLIKKGADRADTVKPMLLINPKRTLALLRNPAVRIMEWTGEFKDFPFPATIMSDDGEDELFDLWVDDDPQLRVAVSGAVSIDDRGASIEILSENGYVAILDERGTEQREVDLFVLSDGALVPAYFVDGERADYDPAAQVWCEDVLKAFVGDRETSLNERVRRLVAGRGLEAFLDRVALLEGDSIRSVFVGALIDVGAVGDQGWRSILDFIGRLIASPDKRADLLIRMIPQVRADQRTLSTLIDAAKKIDSIPARRRVLDALGDDLGRKAKS